MIKINQIKMKIGHTKEQLKKKAADILHIREDAVLELEIARQSLDARKKPELFYIYSVYVKVKDEKAIRKRLDNAKWKKELSQYAVEIASPVVYTFPKPGTKPLKEPVVIVGMGPAGLFCGYFLALHGYAPMILERGRDVDSRKEDVERFWKEGKLNTASNVQFGEGGAGTFSDGKLNTLVKDKDGRNRAVLETFVKFGARPSIVYEAKPHIGTDVLCTIVKKMREEIIRLGGSVRFESQVTDILTETEEGQRNIKGVVVNGQERIPCCRLVLAIGHSARDTFSMLYEKKMPMEAKSFAVGLRVEHPQKLINKSQYGAEQVDELGAAAYKLTAKTSSGRGVYSFCMCPGGYVVNASSEEGRLAVNGMSYSGRDSANANSAIIVSVTQEDFGSSHPLAGIAFQRKLEEKAFLLGKGKIPVQRYGEFKEQIEHRRQKEYLKESGEAQRDSLCFDLLPICKGEYTFADVSEILPSGCSQAFVEGMEAFGKQIKGFNSPDALLLGVESRTSSPVRIHRDENLQSEIKGLYPCGEGAGYAGGITSAAMDGLRVAEAIAREYAPEHTFLRQCIDVSHKIKYNVRQEKISGKEECPNEQLKRTNQR